MKKTFTLLFSLFFLSNAIQAQDTFSICAVDTVTGEVGSAGASCIDNAGCGGCGGVIIIRDVHPGRGVIHTQSYWNATNQNNAKNQMNLGSSPQQIISWLQANDAQGNPAIRQYGIVDFDPNGNPRSAAFTGANCLNYKNHITGPTYAIQGNILLGQQILDSMESRFLNEPGDLACKLMAALQGAKVVGADTRCTSSGNSSLSSFLTVAKPGDIAPNFFIALNVPQGPAGFEPIDSLQTLLNNVHSCVTAVEESGLIQPKFRVLPNPANDKVVIIAENFAGAYQYEFYNALGQKILTGDVKGKKQQEVNISSLEKGMFFYAIVINGQKLFSGKLQKQ